jgi:hypothetical protein
METKPGTKTTEFWVMVYVQVMSLLNLVGIWDYVPNKYSAGLMGAVTFGYAVARGIAKTGVKPTV